MQLAQLIFVIMFACVQAEPCQTGQERFGDSCYQLLDATFTWQDASQTCANMGCGLVVPDSLEEHQFVWEMFTRKVTESANLWIGCNDIDEEDRWVQAGGDRECTYFNWAAGEPHPSFKDWEDCAGMWGYISHDGLWNDLPCTGTYFAICESPAVVPSMSCLLTYDAYDFFAASCLTDRISSSSVAWALVCRDEPRCRSFTLRLANRGTLMSCQLTQDTEVNAGGATSCQFYYF